LFLVSPFPFDVFPGLVLYGFGRAAESFDKSTIEVAESHELLDSFLVGRRFPVPYGGGLDGANFDSLVIDNKSQVLCFPLVKLAF